jgi:hypothetical protein
MMISEAAVSLNWRSYRVPVLTLLTIHSRHDESNLCRVRCACEMGVNLFRLGLVQGHESVENVITSRSIIGSP